MQSMNMVVLVGRLTADPELSTVGANNTSKLRFTLAVNNTRGQKDADGNPVPADFINMEAWAATAETMAQYLSKGSLIGIQGELHTNSYESTKLVDEQGNPGIIYSSYVTVNTFTFLEKKADDSTEGKNNGQGGSRTRQTTLAQSNARAATNRQASAPTGSNRKPNAAGLW